MRPLANFSHSIGSRLKQSFAQINSSSTPVESISGTQPLLPEDETKTKVRRNAIIAGTSVALGTSLLAVLMIGGALLATNTSEYLGTPKVF